MKKSSYIVCDECGAVRHGNLFCNTCRQVMNERHGWNLPPWNHPAEPPVTAEEVQEFIDWVDSINAEVDDV